MLINQFFLLALSLIQPSLGAQNNRQRPFLVEKLSNTLPFDLQPRLIQTSANEEPKWLNPLDIVELRVNNIKFMDVTDEGDVENLKHDHGLKTQDYKIPDKVQYNSEVEGHIAKLDTSEMTQFLTKFTSFPNRYYNGPNGKASSEWLCNNLKEIIQKNNRQDITIKKFSHRFLQNSIIITVPGSQQTDETVVIGSHQDSVNQWLPWFGKAPGADDDGSGTTSVHEAFRVLINGNFKPERNVEFHFYAGEEGGLLGSQDIAKSYAQERRNIVAMMHFDMTGYFGRTEQIAVVTDHTDPELSQFLKKIISAYSELPQVESQCGYACSDHASWNKYGFRSAFPIEDPNIEVNPNIHSPRDLVSTISFHHVKEFSKLVIGFAIELSHI